MNDLGLKANRKSEPDNILHGKGGIQRSCRIVEYKMPWSNKKVALGYFLFSTDTQNFILFLAGF